MFSKILIANRGEIACRVIRTARRMGIKCVAVYSEADKDALHVEMADEAVAIGPAPAAQSYLVIEKIIEACKQTGAEAVHPGYGFLSEREAFAIALEKAGIVFIGPNPRAIRAMGDKIESKKLAVTAKVAIVPGFIGTIADAKEAARIAEEIGFPVMLKASAGGGGKGMRIVASRAEIAEAFQSATNEARASFGDDRVFVEKAIGEPRHIEIQVLGDKHGAIVHLGERECSIQRRHQKVIEESPSPFIDEKTRAAMGAQAVALARAVNYDSAGTVEFIVDGKRNFYFLEMNTRLQVEHPVTELVTGYDLVEQMIRIAAGEKLAIEQNDVKLNGWAVEARIYAEDPYRNFLPSTGRLVRYRPPQSDGVRGHTLRNDTGVFEGADISRFYDPMIAKLCAHAPTRAEAIDTLGRALDGFVIEGIRHNIPFLSAVMNDQKFRVGKFTTNFIAEEYPDGFHGAPLTPERRDLLIAAAAFAFARESIRTHKANGWKKSAFARDWVVRTEEGDRKVTIAPDDNAGEILISLKGKPPREREISIQSDWNPGTPVFTGHVDGEPISVVIARTLDGFRLAHQGAALNAAILRPRVAELLAKMPPKAAADTSKLLLCPMPGLVVSIAVAEGQEVKAGETLAVVEAMKMENALRAERDGIIGKIHVKKGDSLAVDAVILEFK